MSAVGGCGASDSDCVTRREGEARTWSGQTHRGHRAVGSMRRVTGVGAHPEAVPRLSGMGSHLDKGNAAGDERRVSQTSALLVAPLS